MIIQNRLWILFIVGLFVTGCGQSDQNGPSIRIEDAWARPVLVNLSGSDNIVPPESSTTQTSTQPTMDMHTMIDTDAVSAAYLTIINDGREEDRLLGVSSSVARDVSLHQTRYKDDVAEMVMVQEIVIPGKQTVELRPGSYHVMLSGLEHDLVAGETIDLTLHFKKSGEILVSAKIKVN